MLLYYVFIIFILGGFLLMSVAPALMLFKKAAKPSWFALIPGANAVTMIRISGQPIALAGLGTFAALLVFIVFRGLVGFQGDFFQYLASLGILIAVFTAFSLVFMFPLLSTCTFILLSLFGPYKDFLFPVSIAMLVIASLQCAWDFISWIALIKKLKRPLWHLVFLFLAAAVALVHAVLAVLFQYASLALILATFLPTLFIGFVYYYYLGYSLKVTFRKE